MATYVWELKRNDYEWELLQVLPRLQYTRADEPVNYSMLNSVGIIVSY